MKTAAMTVLDTLSRGVRRAHLGDHIQAKGDMLSRAGNIGAGIRYNRSASRTNARALNDLTRARTPKAPLSRPVLPAAGAAPASPAQLGNTMSKAGAEIVESFKEMVAPKHTGLLREREAELAKEMQFGKGRLSAIKDPAKRSLLSDAMDRRLPKMTGVVRAGRVRDKVVRNRTLLGLVGAAGVGAGVMALDRWKKKKLDKAMHAPSIDEARNSAMEDQLGPTGTGDYNPGHDAKHASFYVCPQGHDDGYTRSTPTKCATCNSVMDHPECSGCGVDHTRDAICLDKTAGEHAGLLGQLEDQAKRDWENGGMQAFAAAGRANYRAIQRLIRGEEGFAEELHAQKVAMLRGCPDGLMPVMGEKPMVIADWEPRVVFVKEGCHHCSKTGYVRTSFEDGTRYCHDCMDEHQPKLAMNDGYAGPEVPKSNWKVERPKVPHIRPNQGYRTERPKLPFKQAGFVGSLGKMLKPALMGGAEAAVGAAKMVPRPKVGPNAPVVKFAMMPAPLAGFVRASYQKVAFSAVERAIKMSKTHGRGHTIEELKNAWRLGAHTQPRTHQGRMATIGTRVKHLGGSSGPAWGKLKENVGARLKAILPLDAAEAPGGKGKDALTGLKG